MAFEPLLKSEEQIKRAILRNTTQQRCGLEGWFFTESKGFRQLNSSVVGKFFFFRTSPGSNLRKANDLRGSLDLVAMLYSWVKGFDHVGHGSRSEGQVSVSSSRSLIAALPIAWRAPMLSVQPLRIICISSCARRSYKRRADPPKNVIWGNAGGFLMRVLPSVAHSAGGIIGHGPDAPPGPKTMFPSSMISAIVELRNDGGEEAW
ncbi:hypothetical protein K432DRAFT_438492 [Lepidopterella palustris CBS 459.81]|uniref:Uncharacterized protein n=1 Tax=Lepidopterella palustris CBS 459.81 TaxID=1314670 RepID=A0A8E2JLH2_9PEZI|nr:hypothetical protein K432DRAFT_438492 [Lepidopterella palustris CBS 459.81]